MATLTLDVFRKLTQELPGSWVLVIRDYDCIGEEWGDHDVVLAGIKVEGTENKIILLSEAHAGLVG
jgi:hypothetical protein